MDMNDEDVAVKLEKHDGQIAVALQGVANFKAFTAEQRAVNAQMKEFIVRTDERGAAEKDARDAHERSVKDALDLANAKTAKRSLVWTVAGVITAFAGVAVSIMAIIISSWVIHHSELTPMRLLKAPETVQVLAYKNTQDAISQPHYQ